MSNSTSLFDGLPEASSDGRQQHRISETLLTTGDYATETEAWAAFDVEIEKHSNLFLMEREIEGTYIQARPGTPPKDERIDRILIPRPTLLAAGWVHGPIGVECKHSGKKAGPAIAQAMGRKRGSR